MKILLDFLPIVLFFGMFKYAEGNKEWAAATATDWLGFMVFGSLPMAIGAGVLVFVLSFINLLSGGGGGSGGFSSGGGGGFSGGGGSFGGGGASGNW